VFSPIAGTVVQRKRARPVCLHRRQRSVYVIGDLSTVWLTAFVRETMPPTFRSGRISISA